MEGPNYIAAHGFLNNVNVLLDGQAELTLEFAAAKETEPQVALRLIPLHGVHACDQFIHT